MSAWIVMLALGAAFLVRKNLEMGHVIAASVKEYNSAAQPADGLTSQEVRQVQRTVPPGVKYQDINLQDLPASDVRALVSAQQRAAQEVAAFEAPNPEPIQGVYLEFDNRGV